MMEEKTEIRLALLWVLLNASTEIDASTEHVIKIMESIEKKITRQVCLQYWLEYLSAGLEMFEEKLSRI